MDAFDADALIHAAVPGHRLGRRVAALFAATAPGLATGIGSVLLLPEILSKPLRDGVTEDAQVLAAFLARLDLRPLDLATAETAVALSSAYRLRAADAVHLATAVMAGADRFLTNNSRDFPDDVAEIDIVYLDALPDPGS
jgi:predicted nucleic acid-binding protein